MNNFGDVDEETAPKRKKIMIKAPEENTPSIVKNMMSMDDFSFESSSVPDIKESGEIVEHEKDSNVPGVQRKKIRIVSDDEPESIHPSGEVASAPALDKVFSEAGSVLRADNEASESTAVVPGKVAGREYDNEGQTHH